MNFEWVNVRLGDHIDSCLGKMLDKKKNKGKEQPYLGNSNVRWGEFELSNLAQMKFEEIEHERYGISKGDLIVCEGGEPGRCAIWKEELPDMKIQKALHRVRTKPSLNTRYLYYWFYHAGKNGLLEPYFTGTTIKHLTGKALNNLEIPLPPLPHQEFMAEILGSLDDKIQLNHQINQTLEQMAQAIFKSWFVDFEPVKAKIAALEAGGSEEDALLAAMQAISGNSLFDAGASAAGAEAELARLQAEQPEQFAELRATAELFPSAMQDSELGEIPEGWRVNQIGDLVTRIPVGKKYSQKTASETGDVPVLDQGKSGIIGYHNEKPGVTACPDDPVIVFANHTCYMRLIMHDFSAIQNVLPFKSKPAKALNIFWLYFATHGKQEFIEYKGHWPDFVIKEIVVPDDSISSRFGSIAKDLVVNQFRNEKQNETLSAIRNAMLQKLLSGELSVTDVANQTEGAEGSVNV